MLGVCKVYPELGPLEDIEKCYSFSVLDIRKSDIACGNCQNWIAADSVSIDRWVAMLFEDSNCQKQQPTGACDHLPFAECFSCSGYETGICPNTCDQ